MTTDLRAQLTALLAVAREGSMTRAADRLHCSVSTVSRLVAMLERRTGHALVTRENGRTLLTPAGRTTVAEVCPIACAVEKLENRRPEGHPRTCPAGDTLPCMGNHECPGKAPIIDLVIGSAPPLSRTRTAAPSRHATEREGTGTTSAAIDGARGRRPLRRTMRGHVVSWER